MNAPIEIPLDGAPEQEDFGRSDEQLLSAIAERESGAYGTENDPTSVERAKAIDYYLGRPFGNEIEGRSQVVSRDVSDTIEWIMPSLLRIFTGGDDVCKFDPVGPEDVDGAQQESDYTNYVIQKKNNWFTTAYTWFKDGLLTRNAYCWAYWEDKQEAVIERYRGLTDDQFALLMMDQSVQMVAHGQYPMQYQQMPMDSVQQAMVPTLHDVDVRRVKNYGCVKIKVLPPERCLTDQSCDGMSVRESDFFEYWDWKTISQLRIDGFDVADDIGDTVGPDRTIVDESRDVPNQTILEEEGGKVDPAMRKVKVRMIWIRHDYDRDGISELRYVVAVGKNILVNDEVSGIPVACIVPTPMPHRHTGLSIYDAVADLQIIKSAMLRQVVDNSYLANNSRLGVDKNRVNLDDALVSRPQGLIRTDGPPGESLLPLEVPPTAPHGIAVLNYLDSIRQYRTGTQQPFLGPEALETRADAMPGTVEQLTAAASQKVELIARVFAEGVKELFLIVHELTLTNATAQDKAQLRGKWVAVDPRQWKKRSDMTLSVGVAVGNKRQHVAGLQLLLALARQALPYGLTSLNKIYNMLAELTKALGFADANRFWEEVPENATVQPQEDPKVTAAKINAQAELLVQEMKNNVTQGVTQLKEEAAAARTFFENMVDTQNQREERLLRAVSEATERMQEMRLAKMEKKEPAGAQA